MVREKVTVMGVRVDPLTVKEFIENLTAAARLGERRLVVYLNAANFNRYFADREFARVVDKADIVYADGQAVVWASRFLGAALPERINAGDFLVEFCRAAAAANLPIYWLGSHPGLAESAAFCLAAEVQGLRAAGYRDGFFSDEESPRIAEQIRGSGARIVLVGMGSPRQELWAARWGEACGAPVIWCVGALFEYFAAYRARAPVWMRRAGLEWLFRLLLEPRRLASRYLWGNIVFVCRVLRARIFRP